MQLPLFEPIDHTADAGFLVRGADLPELFMNAGRCLCEALGVLDGVGTAVEQVVKVSADGYEALLRAWLSELLYVSYVGKLVLVEARIDALDEHRVASTVRGEAYDEQRHERHPEIKAVTWHGLEVRQSGDRWEAIFIVDL